jgi:hypothetical protein
MVTRRFVAPLLAGALIASTLFGLSNVAHADNVPRGAKMVFDSGFTGDTVLEDVAPWTQWFTNISGHDRESGYTWDVDLPVKRPPTFQYLISPNKPFWNYVGTYLFDERTPNGHYNTALAMEVKGDDPTFPDLTRNQLNVYWDDDKNSEVYASYWMKLQDNLATLMPAGQSTWRNFMEWRETGPDAEDFRVALYVMRNKWTHPNKKDEFYFAAGAEQIRPTVNTYWQVKNGAVKVPVGEWFFLEVRFKRHVSNGKLQLWVNGQPVFDLNGVRTKKDSALSKWNIFKVYTSPESLARGKAWQWFDDLKIYAIP